MSTQSNNYNKRKGDDVEHWHLDKRVPLSIIFVVILQTVYFTVFVTKLDSRVAVLEQQHIDISKSMKDMAEIKVHQLYLREDIKEIHNFLRDDVEWVKPKKKGTR